MSTYLQGNQRCPIEGMTLYFFKSISIYHTTARPTGSHRYTSTVGATGNIWFRVHVRSHYRHLSTGIQSPRWPGHCYKHLATSATDICSQVCSPPHTELGPGTPTRAPYVQPRPMTVVSSDTHPRHVRDPPV